MSYHSAGITYGDGVGRNIACNHRACADHGTVANSHTRQNSHISSEPHILANGDWLIVKFSFQAFYGINSVVGAYETTPGSDERTMANSDDIWIEERTVLIYERCTLEVDIPTHYTLKTRLHEDILVVSRHKLLENLTTARRRRDGCIELKTEILNSTLKRNDLRVTTAELLSRESLF